MKKSVKICAQCCRSERDCACVVSAQKVLIEFDAPDLKWTECGVQVSVSWVVEGCIGGRCFARDFTDEPTALDFFFSEHSPHMSRIDVRRVETTVRSFRLVIS